MLLIIVWQLGKKAFNTGVKKGSTVALGFSSEVCSTEKINGLKHNLLCNADLQKASATWHKLHVELLNNGMFL